MVQLVSLILIRWIVIYPVGSAIQLLNNRGLANIGDQETILKPGLKEKRRHFFITQIRFTDFYRFIDWQIDTDFYRLSTPGVLVCACIKVPFLRGTQRLFSVKYLFGEANIA